MMSKNKRFSTVFLHIGLGKTGTTAIQRSMMDGACHLESDFDIHYPVNFDDPRPFGGNHTLYLRSLFQSGAEKKRPNIVAGLGTPEAIEKANESLRRHFKMGFDESSASRLLLSAEGIGHFSEESLGKLKAWLDELSDNIQVVVCLRHPRHALAGEIQQRLKTGSLLDKLRQSPPFYSFEKLFSRVERFFSRSEIIAYDYAEACNSPLGVAGLFLQKIGVDGGDAFSSSPVVNKSVSHEATLLLDAINRQRPLIVDGELNPRRCPGDTQAFLRISGKKYIPQLEIVDRLDECTSQDLEWLESSYQLKLDAMGAGQGAVGAAVSGDFSVAALDDLALKISDLANARERERRRVELTRPPAVITGLKPLTLHIGMGKTGTTVLQNFFWNNRERLETRGIDYPSYGVVDHAHHLLSPHIPGYMNERWEFKNVQQWTARLVETELPQVLLSSEIMVSASPAEIRQYFEVVCQRFRPRVVVYLRRQDHMMVSLYNQLVKSGRQQRPLSEIFPRQIARHDYIHRLKPWEHVLGREAMLVRPFEREQLHEGDIRHDFMHQVFGMEIDKKFELASDDPNPGFPLEVLEYKRCLNWVVKDRALHRRCNELLQAYVARRSDGSALPDSGAVLGSDGRLTVLEALVESNGQIAREYLGRDDGRLFYESWPKPGEENTALELTAEEAAAIFSFISGEDPRVAEQIKALVGEHRNAVDRYHTAAVQLLKTSFS